MLYWYVLRLTSYVLRVCLKCSRTLRIANESLHVFRLTVRQSRVNNFRCRCVRVRTVSRKNLTKRKLGHGNHVIIVTSSFSKSSVFKMSSIHTKTKSVFEKLNFSRRISVDGRPNRRNKTASLNFSGIVRTRPKKNNVENDSNSLCIFLTKSDQRFLVNIYDERNVCRKLVEILDTFLVSSFFLSSWLILPTFFST